MKVILGIGTCIRILIAFLMALTYGVDVIGSEKKFGKINMDQKLSPCEMLTNQMIQARNDIKQYVLNSNHFTSEESEKIISQSQNELNRITKEFSKQKCDKNMNEWITPEIIQRVIDQYE